MQVSIKPWGNSQGIRFSREFLASAGIKPNDVLTAEVIDGKITIPDRPGIGVELISEQH